MTQFVEKKYRLNNSRCAFLVLSTGKSGVFSLLFLFFVLSLFRSHSDESTLNALIFLDYVNAVLNSKV